MSEARRLTQAELDATLADLLGESTLPAKRLLARHNAQPFDNEYREQSASAGYVDAMELLAREVAERAVADTAQRTRWIGCSPTPTTADACFRAFVAGFGKRVFRRPLTDAEVNRYAVLQAKTDFYGAVSLAVQAMLQDPEFLYRIEKSEALTPYEVATRMAYFLWGSTPDDALLSAADEGLLLDAASRRAQAERMLSMPRARQQMRRFHAMWLGYMEVPQAPELAAAFDEETAHLIDRVVFDERRDYFDLFRLDETFLTPALAAHYGVDGSGWVKYSDPQRAGILSHAAVLSGFGKFSDTSPTQRGIFVRERLMCRSVEPPPPTVNTDQPPGEDASHACKAERYRLHRESGTACQTCHANFDPIGLGLEQYDIAGKKRDHDDGRPDCPIVGEGELPGVGTFSGPKALSERLLESGDLQKCVVQHLYRFALGRALDEYEVLAAKDFWIPHWEDKGFRMHELLIDFVASDVFAQRAQPQEAP